MYCSNCGNPLEENAPFCKSCGCHILYDTPAEESANDKLFSKSGLFSFKGRRKRGKYFVMNLFIVISLQFAGAIATHMKVPVLFLLPLVVLLCCLVTNTVKRFHDLNQPTSYAMIVFGVGIVGGFIGGTLAIATLIFNLAASLYLLFAKGTEGANEYGLEPN